MRGWHTKVALAWTFSRMPAGDALYYWVQRHVTHSLPTSEANLPYYVDYARQHLSAVEKFRGGDLAMQTFYEFGTGRDLGLPLAFYALGINAQRLVDIRRLVKAGLV